MARALNSFLLRLSRWPRRIAALVCLLLAAASALTPADGAAPHGARPVRDPIAGGLHAGQVAVPIPLASAHAASFVHVGDRVGVYATVDERAGPALLADGLRVLAVSAGDALSDDAPVALVAADHVAALRLATIQGSSAVVVRDADP